MGITGSNTIGLFISFVFCCLAPVLVHPAPPNPPPVSDESALNTLVEQFFAAYAKEDLDGFMELWSENSPEFTDRKQALQQIFADFDNIQVKSLVVVKVKIDGDKAKVRVAVEMTGMEAKTGQPSPRFGKLNRTLYGVKEGSAWKIWQDVATELDLLYTLLASETKEERARMLNEEKGLVTAQFLSMLRRASDTQAEQGKFAFALKLSDLAFEVAETLGDKAELAWCYVYRGLLFYSQSQYATALEKYQRALPLFREAKEKKGEAATLSNIGLVYERMGQYTEALAQYEVSLKMFRELGMKAEEAEVLNNIGLVYSSTGQYAEALAQYEASLKIAKAIGNKRSEAQTLGNIGEVYRLTGKYTSALAQYEVSLKMFRELEMKADEAGELNNIGLVYERMGQYTEALTQYEASLKIAKAIGDKAGEARTLCNIGEVYRLTGKYASALAQYEVSLKVFRELEMKAEEAVALNDIGLVYRSTGQYAEALAQYEASLKEFRELEIKAKEAVALNDIGNVYQLTGQYAEALAQYEASLKITNSQWEPAADAYRKAITLIEQIRAGAKEPSLQMGFFEQYTSPYYGLVTSLLARNHVEDAFQTAERAKARTLVELLEGGRVDITKAMTAEENRMEQELNERITLANLELRTLQSQSNPNQSKLSDVKSRLVAARQDYDAFRLRLYLAHPELQAQRGAFSPLTVAQAAQFILAQKAHDLLVLEYIVGDDQTWLFAFSSAGQLAVYPIKMTHKELSQRVNALREAIRLREADKLGALPPIEAALRQLDSLLEPLANVLAGARQVCIVPDDVLWEVPFAALKTQEGKYLVETHAVFYAPSVTALKAEVETGIKRRQLPSIQLLAMAPFAYPDSENRQRTRDIPLRGTFGALPASLNEVSAVSALFDTKPYLRESATEPRAKTEASRVRLLHFATHGVFEPLQGMYSGVLLAEEKGGGSIGSEGAGEDGYLEAREIVELDLKASLAVLSACETARGQLSRGEGVLGLSWAFFVAGCPSTVVSQWKVKDESTAQLMTAFYRNLKAGKNKAFALRQAQLSLLHSQWPHPFYWSPFILVGDWQ